MAAVIRSVPSIPAFRGQYGYMASLPIPPFNATDSELRFLKYISDGSCCEAVHLLQTDKSINFGAQNERGANVLLCAVEAIYLREIRCDADFNALNWLVERAIGERINITIDCRVYISPLHLIARMLENKITISILKKLLMIAKTEDLNLYNVYGMTPLLEAIRAGNKKIISQFLSCVNLDVNLCRMREIVTIEEQWIQQGFSPLQAVSILAKSTSLEFLNIANAIKSHPKYDSGIKYSEPDSGDIIGKTYYLFAEQGNPDTLRILFRHYRHRLETLMEADDQGWTMLHIASFSANIPVVKFLLDKREIDKAAGSMIDENLYRNFLNHSSHLYSTALGRTLFGAGQSYDKQKNQQIRLFLNCAYFDVNKIHQCNGQSLIHYLVDNNLIKLLSELSERPDVDFDRQNLRGQTALEIAAIAGYYEIVKLLSKFVRDGQARINPNRYNRECKLIDRIRFFMEEEWFGPISISGLNVDNLIEIYRTKEPHKLQITYREFSLNININLISKVDNENINVESIKKHLEYHFNRTHNRIQMRLVDLPQWFDEALYSEIDEQLSQIFAESFLPSTFSMKKEFDLKIRGIQMRMIAKPNAIRDITRSGTLSYQILCDFLGSKDDAAKRHEMLKAEYVPLLALIVEKINAEKEENIKSNLIKVFEELVQFPGIELNILVKKGDNVCYIDNLNTLPEIKSILEKARKTNREKAANSDKNKRVHPLYNVLIESKKNNSAFYHFARVFSNNIEIRNMARQSHHRHDEQEFRRMDSLARLFEVDGVCAAVCFHGGKILYATNEKINKNKENLSQHKIIQEMFSYFSKISNNPKNHQKLETEKINLICNAIEAKILRGFNPEKGRKFKKYILEPIIKTLCEKFHVFENFIDSVQIGLNEDGLLSQYSFEKLLKFLELETYERFNQDEKGKKIFDKDEVFKRYVNVIIRDYIRAMLDMNKIDQYILANPENPFVIALKDNKHIQLVGENETYHAEMKLFNYILTNDSPFIGKKYIGVTKLCCPHCNLIFSSFNKSNKHNKNSIILETRGFHCEDPKWPLPPFLEDLEKFKIIFGEDSELYRAFKASCKISKKNTLQFIEEYAQFKEKHKLDFFMYESLARKPRNEKHDWSDSDSDPDSESESEFDTEAVEQGAGILPPVVPEKVESIKLKFESEARNLAGELQAVGVPEASIQIMSGDGSVGQLFHLVVKIGNNLELVKKVLGDRLQAAPVSILSLGSSPFSFSNASSVQLSLLPAFQQPSSSSLSSSSSSALTSTLASPAVDGTDLSTPEALAIGKCKELSITKSAIVFNKGEIQKIVRPLLKKQLSNSQIEIFATQICEKLNEYQQMNLTTAFSIIEKAVTVAITIAEKKIDALKNLDSKEKKKVRGEIIDEIVKLLVTKFPKKAAGEQPLEPLPFLPAPPPLVPAQQQQSQQSQQHQQGQPAPSSESKIKFEQREIEKIVKNCFWLSRDNEVRLLTNKILQLLRSKDVYTSSKDIEKIVNEAVNKAFEDAKQHADFNRFINEKRDVVEKVKAAIKQDIINALSTKMLKAAVAEPTGLKPPLFPALLSSSAADIRGERLLSAPARQAPVPKRAVERSQGQPPSLKQAHKQQQVEGLKCNQEGNKEEAERVWYSTDLIKKLVYSQPKKSFFRYIFSTSGDPSKAFINQFKALIKIQEAKNFPVYFIASQPGEVDNQHFIFGIIVKKKLLIINPMGITAHKDFYPILKNIKDQKMIEDIYISDTHIQKDPKAIVSCGPICVELFNCFTLLTELKILEIMSNEPLQKRCRRNGLDFKSIDISKFLSKNLKKLLDCEPEQYSIYLESIRKNHRVKLGENSIEEECYEEETLMFRTIEQMDEEEAIRVAPSSLNPNSAEEWYDLDPPDDNQGKTLSAPAPLVLPKTLGVPTPSPLLGSGPKTPASQVLSAILTGSPGQQQQQAQIPVLQQVQSPTAAGAIGDPAQPPQPKAQPKQQKLAVPTYEPQSKPKSLPQLGGGGKGLPVAAAAAAGAGGEKQSHVMAFSSQAQKLSGQRAKKGGEGSHHYSEQRASKPIDPKGRDGGDSPSVRGRGSKGKKKINESGIRRV